MFGSPSNGFELASLRAYHPGVQIPAMSGVLCQPAMSARASTAVNRVVIVICDSLRADLITARDAPFLAEFAERSARFANHRSVFPSTTRTSAASIATGCLPARHGLLG